VTTVQLRRYDIEPGQMDAFVSWWRSIIEPRRVYGFRVEFAYVDEDHSQFVWAVAHDGDFDEAEAKYMASPERADAFATHPDVITSAKVAKVQVLDV
jgi:hypothetical protein